MASHLATERMEHTPSVLPVLMVDQSDATGQQLISTAEYSAFMDWTNDTMDATKAKVRFLLLLYSARFKFVTAISLPISRSTSMSSTHLAISTYFYVTSQF